MKPRQQKAVSLLATVAAVVLFLAVLWPESTAYKAEVVHVGQMLKLKSSPGYSCYVRLEGGEVVPAVCGYNKPAVGEFITVTKSRWFLTAKDLYVQVQ